MINIELNIVINILSLNEFSRMTVKEREEFSENEGIEQGEIFEYLKEKYNGVKVSYVEEKIKTLYQLPITVFGSTKELNPCPCCNFKTIFEKGNYQICPVCFWEDDGNTDDMKTSSANHMTLKEAKENFKSKGAISDQFLKFVDKESEVKYYKNNYL
ncbi:CPCC family cysteine-rich protein [Chryseobacterium sp. BLS98]|uniref:CPCC family cysteine-rich protein n=1 Tax=Chryseobacterium sp. BLS98 TaxID=885586 RepID=UPI001E5D3F9D|nr:CPCC family cysteine-rich protein [Chryseobacterium sp. BLS98]